MIDYDDLIGVPFEYGGRGPDTYDCYGLLAECERRTSGKEIPDFQSTDVITEIAMTMGNNKYRWECHAQRTQTEPVPFSELKPGRSILISVKGLHCHVGFIHKSRYFLHTWEGVGSVLCEPLQLWRQKIIGVYEFA